MPSNSPNPSEGYLEVTLEPEKARDRPWWRRLVAAFRLILPSKGQAVADLRKAQEAAVSGGIATLERPHRLNELSSSEIERNLADARLKANQADREKAEEERTRLMTAADLKLKGAEAEKVQAETRIAEMDMVLRAIDKLEAHGFQVTPIIDPRTNRILIADLRPRGGAPARIVALDVGTVPPPPEEDELLLEELGNRISSEKK